MNTIAAVAGNERRGMATSSIGQPVVLDEERAKRLMEIMSRPHKRAKSESGRKLKLTHVKDLKLDPKKFE